MKKSLITIISLSFLISCSDKLKEQTGSSVELCISSDTTTKTTCPYLTNDNKGNIVLSWVKELNDSVAYVCYAVSEDKGKTFGVPTEITASKDVHPHGENMPKVIFKPNGEIIAMWGVGNSNPKNKYSGLVYYTQSFDNGKTWSDATPLVKDTASFDQRYFDLAILPSGEVMAIWLDNRKKTDKDGSTLYRANTSGKKGFENEKAISETCCQCCRTDLFIDSNGGIHVSYRDIINDSIRDMVHMVSNDGGNTFSQAERISADNWAVNSCPHTGPTMAENNNGLHFAWYTMGGGEGVFYCNSKDFGKTYSNRESVSGKPSAKHPQIAILPSGNIVIVWDETVKKGEKNNACIGLQERNAKGKVLSTKFISSDDAVSEFAVIKPIDEKTVLIAYKQRKDKKANVFYKQVVL